MIGLRLTYTSLLSTILSCHKAHSLFTDQTFWREWVKEKMSLVHHQDVLTAIGGTQPWRYYWRLCGAERGVIMTPVLSVSPQLSCAPVSLWREGVALSVLARTNRVSDYAVLYLHEGCIYHLNTHTGVSTKLTLLDSNASNIDILPFFVSIERCEEVDLFILLCRDGGVWMLEKESGKVGKLNRVKMPPPDISPISVSSITSETTTHCIILDNLGRLLIRLEDGNVLLLSEGPYLAMRTHLPAWNDCLLLVRSDGSALVAEVRFCLVSLSWKFAELFTFQFPHRITAAAFYASEYSNGYQVALVCENYGERNMYLAKVSTTSSSIIHVNLVGVRKVCFADNPHAPDDPYCYLTTVRGERYANFVLCSQYPTIDVESGFWITE